MHHYEHRAITRQTNASLAAFAIFLAILPSIATAQGNRTGHGDSARRIDISPTHVDGHGLAKNPGAQVTPAHNVRYKTVAIGVLPGKTNSVVAEEPGVINNLGHVAGFSFVFTGDTVDYYLTAQPFLWVNGKVRSLPLLKGWPGAFATGVNDHDQVIGEANNFDSDGNRRRTAVMWSHDKVIDLGTLDSNSNSAAFGINVWGVVAGFNFSFITGHRTPVAWYGGAIHALPLLPGQTEGFAFGINDAGVIAGYQSPEDDSSETACLWYWNGSSYVAVPLGTLGGNYGDAFDVNIWGGAVGAVTTANDANLAPVQWNSKTPLALPLLSGDTDGIALAISDLGQILGLEFGVDANGNDVQHAVLWQHGTVTDLQTVVPAKTPTITDVGNINVFGQIAIETGFFDDGSLAAYVLVPKDN